MRTPPPNEFADSRDEAFRYDQSPDVESPDEVIHLQLMEETLKAHIVEREQGKILIHRRVETKPIQARIDLVHDDVVIDQIEVNDFASERREPWYEGEMLMVPIYEEVLVTETRLLLRSIIRLNNKGRHEQVKLRGTIRREVVDIEEIDL